MARKRAFTLIEVLVVVAIIALLISIALPSISEAKRISKRTYCMQNLHGIGVALQAYVQANREKFPVLCPYLTVELTKPAADRRPPISRGLGNELQKGNKVLECPADIVTDVPTDSLGSTVADVKVGGRYFDVEETSYEWQEAFNGLPRDIKAVTVGGIVISVRDVGMLYDYEAFHGPKAHPRSRNYLYPDLRVASEQK